MKMIKDLGMMSPTPSSKYKKRYGIFICDCCKKEYRMQIQDAKRCGDICKVCSLTTHGMTNSKNYSRWVAMKTRCRNENHSAYNNYGGRGIYISSEFIDNFEAYNNYIDSLPNANVDGYTVDRIDNNKGYERGNLKWSSRSEQGLNRRKSKYVGVRKSGKKYRYARTLNGEYLSFGTYDTKEEAIMIGTQKYEEYKQANKSIEEVIDVEAEDND